MKLADNKKIFFDAVHGSIYIESDYCKYILDTEHFQRLRRLEQTNLRPLYPCAHHDRFIHSIGVFHLGLLAFKSLRSNSEDELKVLRFDLDWNNTKKHFELACLLHDIGHAPFSHTFEEYYQKDEDLDKYLQNPRKIKFSSEQKTEFDKFVQDYSKLLPKPKAHEKVSAIIVLTKFYKVLRDSFRVDPFLISRMILGLHYANHCSQTENFHNCFISLLNGTTIDVDKLDYIARDQWATGNISKGVNIERLLSSIVIKHNASDKHEFIVCYHKRAINEIFSIIEAKNAFNVRFYGHHTVKYNDYILTQAVEQTTSKYFKRKGAISKIISLKALLDKVIYNNTEIRLPTDDDLIHIVKSKLNESEFAKEWANRNYSLKPVWKTYPDYVYYFKSLSNIERDVLFYQRIEFTNQFLTDDGYEMDQFLEIPDIETQYNPIYSQDIKIYIKDKIINFKELLANQGDEKRSNISSKTYFLLFIPKKIVEDESKRKKFIDFLIQSAKTYTKRHKRTLLLKNIKKSIKNKK